MIGFLRPELLLLALPWLLFWAWFARRQRRSCEWVWRHVHQRFRERFTLYRRQTLGRRMALLLLLGLLLVVAAAGPRARGETEVRELASRVVLLLDGSASMLADDVATAEGMQTRFERGRQIAVELADRLEGSRFALVVFSGVAALQLPMTADPATLDEGLGAASFHTFYRSSGSSFTAALDSVLHFVEPGRGDLQAVLLSDGEQPFAEPFDVPLAALEEAGVPVHAVAIGSQEGQTRLIFDFRDVVAGKEEKSVLREYTTRREDRHLKRIARRSGGRFARADGGAAAEVAAAVERRIAGARTVSAEGWRDLSAVPLTLFLVGFLIEALLWGRRGRRSAGGFDINRLGEGRPAAAAGLLLLLAAGLVTVACRDDSPLGQARRENARGIAADALRSWKQARVHYDRSRAFDVQPEIPAYNLARSVTLQEDWSEAHELYQSALELAPGLAVAHYNDGHALYRWGEAELDLERCELRRTLELWDAARRRFAGAAELYPEESAGRARAADNLRFIARRVTQIEEACAPPPPRNTGGGKGESEAPGGGRARGGDGGGDEESAEGEAGDQDEDEGGGQGGGEQEGGGQGGGEQEGGGGGSGEEQAGGGDEGEGEGGAQSQEPAGEGDEAGEVQADSGEDGESTEEPSGGEESGGEGENDGRQEPSGDGGGGEGENDGQEPSGDGGGGEGENEGQEPSGDSGGDEGESDGQEPGGDGGDGESESDGQEPGGDGGEGEGDGERSGQDGDDGEEVGDSGGAGASDGGGGDSEEQEEDGEGGAQGGSGPGDGAAAPPLTGDELEQIQQALARIGEGRFADGRYHYRSLPEQFPKEAWESPEAEIWW